MQPEVMGDLGENHPVITHGPEGDFEGDLGGAPFRGRAPNHPSITPDPRSEAELGCGRRHNRHPVDELADVRTEIRRLQAREAELRDAILGGSCGLVGDQHEASVRTTGSERVDVPALRKELGLERLKPFLRQTTTRTVRVTGRELPEDA